MKIMKIHDTATKPHDNCWNLSKSWKSMKMEEIAARWYRAKVSMGPGPRWHSRPNLGPVKFMKSHELLTTYENHENEFPSLLLDQQNTRLSNSRLAQKNHWSIQPSIRRVLDGSAAEAVACKSGRAPSTVLLGLFVKVPNRVTVHSEWYAQNTL